MYLRRQALKICSLYKHPHQAQGKIQLEYYQKLGNQLHASNRPAGHSQHAFGCGHSARPRPHLGSDPASPKGVRIVAGRPRDDCGIEWHPCAHADRRNAKQSCTLSRTPPEPLWAFMDFMDTFETSSADVQSQKQA